MNLHLNLTKKWFDRHLQDKTEEYRAITPYWCNRLLLYKGKIHSIGFWEEFQWPKKDALIRFIKKGIITFKPYTEVTFSNGMKAIDQLPRFKKPIKEMGVWQGRPEWGADPNTFYFVIRCGEAYELQNCTKARPRTPPEWGPTPSNLDHDNYIRLLKSFPSSRRFREKYLCLPYHHQHKDIGFHADGVIVDEASQIMQMFSPLPHLVDMSVRVAEELEKYEPLNLPSPHEKALRIIIRHLLDLPYTEDTAKQITKVCYDYNDKEEYYYNYQKPGEKFLCELSFKTVQKNEPYSFSFSSHLIIRTQVPIPGLKTIPCPD